MLVVVAEVSSEVVAEVSSEVVARWPVEEEKISVVVMATLEVAMATLEVAKIQVGARMQVVMVMMSLMEEVKKVENSEEEVKPFE